MPLPTLDDLKTHLTTGGRQADLNADDAELSDVLYAAVDVVEGIVGPLRSGQVTETHYDVTSPVLVLRTTPVGELVSVATRPYPGWAATSYPTTDYVLDPAAGLLRTASGYRFGGTVTVTYTTGRDSLPAAIRLATLMIARQMWDTQRGSQPLPLQGAADDQPTFASFAPGIPERARILLEPFARGPQVA